MPRTGEISVCTDGWPVARTASNTGSPIHEVPVRLSERAIESPLADKVVGKAVAMVAVEAGIRAIYTPLASHAAQQVLDQYAISLNADRMVPLIRNKRNDGPCPMERLTLPLDAPSDAVAALKNFVGRTTPPTPQSEG